MQGLLNFSLAFGSVVITNNHGSQECVNWHIDKHERAVRSYMKVFFGGNLTT